MSKTKRTLFHLSMVMLSLVTTVLVTTLYILYVKEMKHQQLRLMETLQEHRHIIEAIGRFDAKNSQDAHIGGSVAATLSQVIDAHTQNMKKQNHREFLLGKKVEDIVWLIINNHDLENGLIKNYNDIDFKKIVTTPFNSNIAMPMKLALQGKKGTIIEKDYKDVLVLAAYSPLKIGDEQFGIVVKINMSKIREPFINTAFIVMIVSILLTILARIIFKKFSFSIIKELERQEQQLRSLIQNTPGGTFRYDIKHRKVLFISNQIETITGYKLQEYYDDFDTSMYRLVGIKELENRDEVFKNIKVNDYYKIQYPAIRLDDKKIWIREYGQKVFDSIEKLEYIDGVVFDITQEKMINEELNQHVNDAIQELREKDEILIRNARLAAMGEMISMIAHQWRQPISGIGLIANNMLLDIEMDSFDTKEAKENLELVDYQVHFLSKTIDDFRNFFKPQKDKIEYDVKELIDDTMQIIGKSLENNNIEVVLQLENTKRIKIFKNEMIQVVLNIIKNAQDIFNEDGIKDAKLLIKSYNTDDGVLIAIEDNAGGAPSEIIDKLFEPYFSTKNKKTGTGLGLYMSKMIVEGHHKGKIKIFNINEGMRCEILI